MVGEIRAILIFEMLGRPPEHLKSTLSGFIDKIGQEEGIEMINKKVNEPKRLEQAKQELYTTFAETEINFKDLPSLLKIIFVCMPSHIEIIEPEEMRIKNFDFNTLINELVRKLHQYDEIAKKLSVEKSILQRQLLQNKIQPAVPVSGQQAPAQVKEVKKGKSKKVKEKKKETKKVKKKGKAKIKKKSKKKK